MISVECTTKGIICDPAYRKKFEVFVKVVHINYSNSSFMKADIIAHDNGGTWLVENFIRETEFLFEVEIKTKSPRKLSALVRCSRTIHQPDNAGIIIGTIHTQRKDWVIIEGVIGKRSIKKEKVVFI